jgi:hypothetical protein
MRRRALAGRIAVLPLVAAAGLLPLSPAASASGVHLSPAGSDANPCTESRPCRTISRGQAVASAGQTVWLHPGSYGAEGTSTDFRKQGVTWSGMAREARPRLLGTYVISDDRIRLTRVIIDGPAGFPGHVGVDVYRGSNIRIDHCEVRDVDGNAGIYVSTKGHGISIDHCWIHDNGRFGVERAANVDHGVYWARGSGRLVNNLIEHNYTHGVQLYPASGAVRIIHNTFVRNGRASIMVNTTGGPSTIANNIVALGGDNGNQPALFHYQHAPPVAYNNLFWHNANGHYNGGFRHVRRYVGNPVFAADYDIGRGSAARNRGSSAYAVADDFDGNRRVRRADIGAFEAGG